MYFDQLLDKVSEPADIAIFLLGFVIGFTLENLNPASNIPSGTVAGIVAMGCLGIKKGIEAFYQNSNWLTKRRLRKRMKSLIRFCASDPILLARLESIEKVLEADIMNTVEFEGLLNEEILKNIFTALSQSIESQADHSKMVNDLKIHYEGQISKMKIELGGKLETLKKEFAQLQKEKNELFDDTKKLHCLAKSPTTNEAKIIELWNELEDKHFHSVEDQKQMEELFGSSYKADC